jgi:hypothetical protein
MIISDLEHLEVIAEEQKAVVGGGPGAGCVGGALLGGLGVNINNLFSNKSKEQILKETGLAMAAGCATGAMAAAALPTP